MSFTNSNLNSSILEMEKKSKSMMVMLSVERMNQKKEKKGDLMLHDFGQYLVDVTKPVVVQAWG